MDEGTSDRAGKRRRTYKIGWSSHGVNKSSSDTELAQSRKKNRRRNKSKEIWPLLEGLTVDELARYRRRRVEGQPKDNLQVYVEAENEDLVSEYRQAFRARSEESLEECVWPRNLGTKESSESRRALVGKDVREREEVNPIKNKTSEINDDNNTMETEPLTNSLKRNSLSRRGTSFKRDSELYTDTETYSSYVAYEGRHKPDLARRSTSLKMEGDLETTTEKCEKFIQWLNVSRPELIRVPTHLKLEGEFETTTENQEKYVPFIGVRRPELLRQNTNLKLNGEANFVPEYTDMFKKHDNKERPHPVKPETHLKTGNLFFENTYMGDAVNFIDPSIGETRLTHDSNKDSEEERKKKKELMEKQRKDEEMKMLVSKLEDLKTSPLEIPEYKDAYKDFPRERPKIIKPEDEIGRADGSKILSSPTLKFVRKIDQDPEYKSKYLDYQRDCRKSPLSSRSTFNSSQYGVRFGRQDCKRYDHEITSEVRAQYIPYGHIPRIESLKMPANLRLEGNLDLEPEYKTAYCVKRENQLQADQRMHRRRDRSLSASRRKENYWINNNSEQFGFTNAAQDQDAFQILNTRVHEDNVCGKPPLSNRRGSKSSQMHVQRQMQSNMEENNKIKHRSTSPTYRLHVCNVDDEPKGFRHRHSPSFQSSERIHDSSSNCVLQTNIIRPYSPSFGKNTKQHINGQSFVVLDNETFDKNKNEIRRRQTDQNYNIDGTLSISKKKTKPSANWMPPWYDSTNSI